MKKQIVRFLSLYVFNTAALLLIGLLMSSVRVGWHALWAAVVLTLATLALKPLLLRVFRGAAAKSASTRTKIGEKTVQYALVFVVELVVWTLTVWFSGVSVSGWFWGYVLPPVYLLIAWVIYDQVDDRIEKKTGEVYDTVQAKMRGGRAAEVREVPEAPPVSDDGLTPEQRRMLDEL